jgi:hypothetical protein
VNIYSFNSNPSDFIKLHTNVNNNKLNFLIDTQADISVIKFSSIRSYAPIDRSQIINVKGVTHDTIQSIGVAQLSLFIKNLCIQHPFHIVPESFNIPVDAIIGKDFIHKYYCDILNSSATFLFANSIRIPIYYSLENHLYIPPRAEVIRKFEIDTSEDCLIDNCEISPGIFISRTIVNPKNAYIRVLNTNENFVKICNRLTQFEPLKNFNIYSIDAVNTNFTRDNLLINILSNNSTIVNNEPLLNLCTKYSDIFALKTDKMSINNFYTQSLRVIDKDPVYIKNYRNPHSTRDEINKQVDNLLNNDLIEPSMSNYNSPIILVPKKNNNNEKKWRLCIDYRRLNKKLIADKFPLPRIDEILENLGKAKFFSVLDLYSGFHQIPLNEESRDLTAFSTENGSYRWKVLPFGLNIAPNSFSRMMHLAFSGLPVSQCFIYIDDIIVVGASEKHHLKNLENIFGTCRKFNLKLNPEKCTFFKTEVTFLGHVCTENGILPDSSKFNSIKKYPIPHDGDAVKRFVAMSNYYRKFIPNFAIICQPLNKLTRKNSIFSWTDECNSSFNKIKKLLLKPNILAYPDFSSTFTLTVDASKAGTGAVLSQNNKPIAFASKCFNNAEQKKPTIEQELIAIHWAIKHFRPYLYGYFFIIKSDHKPLIYLYNLKDPSSKLTRLRLELSEYNFVIEHIPGKDNVVADALSRIHIKDIINSNNTAKSINVITRSMSKNAQKQNEKNINNENEAIGEKPRIYEVKNYFISKKVPLIIASLNHKNIDVNKNNLNIEIKAHDREIIGKFPYKSKNFLREFFLWLDKISAERDLPKIKIYDNNVIFNTFPKSTFIETGLETLKNTCVAIIKHPKYIHDITERENIIKLNHDHPIFGGHIGRKRLHAKIRQNFIWPHMTRDIASHVIKCHKCQTNKVRKHTKMPMCITNTPTKPFDQLSIDTIGPLPCTENNNNYAVTIICNLTKFLIIVPVSNKDANSVAQSIVHNVFLPFGLCHTILTDMGTEYVNKLFSAIAKILNITHVTSTPYHPQTMGTIERSHRTLNEYLRSHLNPNSNNWDTFVQYFAYSYNITPHTSFNCKFSPFELMFGRAPITPDVLENSNIDPIYNIEDYSKQLQFNLKAAYAMANDLLTKSKQANKLQFDKAINNRHFNINDYVLILTNNHKLKSTYDGPYIIKNIDDFNVTIYDEKTNKQKTVHRNKIIKYFK